MATDLSLGHREAKSNEANTSSDTPNNKSLVNTSGPLTKDNYPNNIILYGLNHSGLDSASIVRDELANINNTYSDLHALELYHKALHEERHKVQAFEHELPYCMQLLDDAIEASREHLEDRLACKLHTPSADDNPPRLLHTGGPTLLASREFHTDGSHLKRKWIPYVDVESDNQARPSSIAHPITRLMPNKSSNDHTGFEHPSSSTIQIQGAVKGHIAKFEELRGKPEHPLDQNYIKMMINSEPTSSMEISHLSSSPMTSRSNMDNITKLSNELQQMSPLNISKPTLAMPNTATSMHSVQRKPRRCWSPELHQLFLKSLNHLGGCQVATPKQIRELMNVEGLTNDEVKSHLQKFRLHMRRPNSSTMEESSKQGGVGDGNHLVVFRCNTLMHGLSPTHNYNIHHNDRQQMNKSLPFVCDNSEVTSMEDGDVEDIEHEQRENIRSRDVDHQRPRLDITHGNFGLRIACNTANYYQ